MLDAQGVLICNPYHYRDSRTDGMPERAFERVPREEIPESREERIEWLYRWWERIDEWVAEHRAPDDGDLSAEA